ncbi:MAG: aminofutalosine synthase MqnE [Methylacidiphilales bacterium]|nr:aminofutalosine synthase MqnE [Candidatus Methylacidiphilales bacterium]MDW8349588.1 aminofutalosine synthase MqnE [Verrucomicrobiae bacterium]
MDSLLKQIGLHEIYWKVLEGSRLSEEDALKLYRCPNLPALSYLATIARRRLNGDSATYVLNRYINYSNVCILSCQFCAFARKKNAPGAFTFEIEEIIQQAREAYEHGVREVHIVGGLHPNLPWDYYTKMIRGIKASCPEMWIKAFTAIEIRHLADRIARKPVSEVLSELKDCGLGSLTGGGAEIFDATVRDQICRGKESAEEWLEVHRLWHQMGGRSTCTMLYGHVETLQHRVDHLRRLRDLQDETGGFTAFIPFAFESENNALSHIKRCTAVEDLRNIAVARLYLDNIRHITAYWISLGLPLAQIALYYGADDLHGTITVERIFHMAGARTPQEQTAEELRQAILEAGFRPVRRDTWYQPVEVEVPG